MMASLYACITYFTLCYADEDNDDREMYIMSDILHMLRIDPNNLETLYKVNTFISVL